MINFTGKEAKKKKKKSSEFLRFESQCEMDSLVFCNRAGAGSRSVNVVAVCSGGVGFKAGGAVLTSFPISSTKGDAFYFMTQQWRDGRPQAVTFTLMINHHVLSEISSY